MKTLFRETQTETEYNTLLPPSQEEDQEAYTIAIDLMSSAMAERMQESFQRGRNGWNRPALCNDFRLLSLLEHSIDNGDIVDIANFTMMLHARGHKNIQALRDDRERTELGRQIATLTELERSLIDSMNASSDPEIIANLQSQLASVMSMINEQSSKWNAVSRRIKGA